MPLPLSGRLAKFFRRVDGFDTHQGTAGKWRKLRNRGGQPLLSDFSFPIVFTIVYRINDFLDF